MPLAFDRSGSGPPLVLLHPLGADRHVWRPVLEYLTPVRDCVAVDLPGFGDSPPLTGDVAPPALARAVIELLSELGFDGARAHLAGNSLGGWVALDVALSGAAASVTAIAPAGLWKRSLRPKPELARGLAKAVKPLLPAIVRSESGRRALLRGSMVHPERVPAADALALVRAYANAPGFTPVNRAMRAGTFGELAQIPVPVTLVWPEHDRVVTRVHGTPAGVNEIVLADCGHIPMWDDPAAVADALLEGSAGS